MGKGLWTVLIYMAADNNLEENAFIDLGKLKAAMTQAGTSKDVRVLVQLDPFEEGVSTKRFEISSQTGGEFPASDVVTDLGNDTNTGKSEVLTNFLKWGIKRAPAKNYFVVIWNHGTGIDDTNIYRVKGRSVQPRRRRPPIFSIGIDKSLDASVELIGTDDEAEDFLDTVELQTAFLDLKADPGLKLQDGIAIIAFDACYMAMAEIYHQLRDIASYGVGSEEITPLSGWPYKEVILNLLARPEAGPDEVARMLVEEYMRFYEATPQEPVTLSAVNLSVSDTLKRAVDNLADALLKTLDSREALEILMLTHYQVQSYYELRYVDLLDFCALLLRDSTDVRVRNACEEVTRVLTGQGYIHASGQRGESVANSHGVAIYFPKRLLSPTYVKLDFSTGNGSTHWADLVVKYTELISRRESLLVGSLPPDKNNFVDIQTDSAYKPEGRPGINNPAQRVRPTYSHKETQSMATKKSGKSPIGSKGSKKSGKSPIGSKGSKKSGKSPIGSKGSKKGNKSPIGSKGSKKGGKSPMGGKRPGGGSKGR